MIIWFAKQNFYEYWRHVVSLPTRADLCFGVCVGGGGGVRIVHGVYGYQATSLCLFLGLSSGREIVLYTGLLLS